jgi:hypothetical protein
MPNSSKYFTRSRLQYGLIAIIAIVLVIGIIELLRVGVSHHVTLASHHSTLLVLHRIPAQSIVVGQHLLVVPPHPFSQKIALVTVRVIQHAFLHGQHYAVIQTSTVGHAGIDPWRLVLPEHVWTVTQSIPVLGIIYGLIHANTLTIAVTLLIVVLAEVALLVVVYRALIAIMRSPHR